MKDTQLTLPEAIDLADEVINTSNETHVTISLGLLVLLADVARDDYRTYWCVDCRRPNQECDCAPDPALALLRY